MKSAKGQRADFIMNSDSMSPTCVLKLFKTLRVKEVVYPSNYIQSDLKNTNCLDLFSGNDVPLVTAAVMRAFENKKSTSLVVSCTVFGSPQVLELLVVPQRLHQRVQNALMIFTDYVLPESAVLDTDAGFQALKNKYDDLVKENRVLAEELENEKKSSELKSMFVSIASHQFRTPLTVIMSNAGLLRMMLGQADQSSIQGHVTRIINRIEAEVKRMTFTMDDVLLLGKIKAGSIKPKKRPLDLVAFTKRISEDYNSIQDDGRKLGFMLIGPPRLLNLDAKLMDDVLCNLISNALKYSPNRPAPEITLTFCDSSTSIAVKDSGMGIPKEEKEKIFEPFFRASNAADISGTGLGTAIAREFVMLNGGRLELESEMGVGSEFKLIFDK